MMRDTKDDNQAKIYMCQGPPGTGKSQTITGIVRALLQVSDIHIDFIHHSMF
jgi:Cdc6-like AAA superfamily ATPase